MEIKGYSERGIINSLIFTIGRSKKLMDEFIQLLNISELKTNGEVEDYTVMLEQSFSQFGDADLIIIIHYINPKHNRVLFIEGKVNTYSKKWHLNKRYSKYKESKNEKEKYNGYTSNLFFQLHLKRLLIDKWRTINKSGSVVEPHFKKVRKIGDNKIVKDAFHLINCEKAYYIGLIPSSEKEINGFNLENKTDIHFLSWKDVHNFCLERKGKFQEVLNVFEFNKGQIYRNIKT